MLKKTFFISLLSHIALFGIFSFSFGRQLPERSYPCIFFWGQFLPGPQVSPVLIAEERNSLKAAPKINPRVLKTGSTFLEPAGLSSKPNLPYVAASEKKKVEDKIPLLFSLERKEQPLIFYPLLPNSFRLYFRDRQFAHVELDFYITKGAYNNSMTIKRKVSSGNLEVDLLSKRYIQRHLFMQRMAFVPGRWQTVKIDLSAEND